MTRKLKVAMLAVLALSAFGALGASNAQAAPEFHCSVEPCTWTLQPDEVSATKTAHHVIQIDDLIQKTSIFYTCNRITGTGTTKTKTSPEITFEKIEYDGCLNQLGVVTKVKMNGCHYLFKTTATAPEGTLTIQGCEKDEKGNPKKIEFEAEKSGCITTIPEQGPLAGVVYHLHQGKFEFVTAELNIQKISVTLDGDLAKCGIEPKHFLEATYTTGNTLFTGESDPGGVMANAWYE